MNAYNSMLMGMGAYTPPTEDDWYGHSGGGSGTTESGSGSGSGWDFLNKVTENVLKPGADIYNTLKNSANASANSGNVNVNAQQQSGGGSGTMVKVAIGAVVVSGVAFALYQVFKPKKKG